MTLLRNFFALFWLISPTVFATELSNGVEDHKELELSDRFYIHLLERACFYQNNINSGWYCKPYYDSIFLNIRNLKDTQDVLKKDYVLFFTKYLEFEQQYDQFLDEAISLVQNENLSLIKNKLIEEKIRISLTIYSTKILIQFVEHIFTFCNIVLPIMHKNNAPKVLGYSQDISFPLSLSSEYKIFTYPVWNHLIAFFSSADWQKISGNKISLEELVFFTQYSLLNLTPHINNFYKKLNKDIFEIFNQIDSLKTKERLHKINYLLVSEEVTTLTMMNHLRELQFILNGTLAFSIQIQEIYKV